MCLQWIPFMSSKTLRCVGLVVILCLWPTWLWALELNDAFFDELTVQQSTVDKQLIARARLGDRQAALDLSKAMRLIGNEPAMYQSEALLLYAAEVLPAARLRLGWMYLQGFGLMMESPPRPILKSPKEAVRWFEAYLAEPDPAINPIQAVVGLGDAYMEAEAYDEARAFLEQYIWAIVDDPTGSIAFNLGVLYRDGLGGPQNLEAAYKAFSVAADQGLNIAVMERNDLAIELGK